MVDDTVKVDAATAVIYELPSLGSDSSEVSPLDQIASPFSGTTTVYPTEWRSRTSLGDENWKASRADKRVTNESEGHNSPCNDGTGMKAEGLSLHPSVTRSLRQTLLAPENFRSESDVDILYVSCLASKYLPSQNDRKLEELTRTAYTDSHSCPRLLALMIKLEKSPKSPWGHKASISVELIKSIFDRFDIHEGFLPDLLGRPNYWAAVSRLGDNGVGSEDAFEFYCQQPRWSQSKRYDSGNGHAAPCSVYMRHSRSIKLTVYLVVTSESEDWFPLLLDRIGVVDRKVECSEGIAASVSTSPFALHAIISGLALEQSMEYVAAVKDRLMTQIGQVNDYSDRQTESTAGNMSRHESESRAMLEKITKQLHLVSQTADSGIANAHMSIKLCEKMLTAHATYCMGPRPINLPKTVRETHGALEYIRDSFYCQRDWLTTYKARKDTAMNFVFNMVTQQDTATNMDISYKMSRDSSSMNVITIITMIFLPGTFAATLFSSEAFSTGDDGSIKTTGYLVPMITVTAVLTVATLGFWYFRKSLSRYRRRVVSRVFRNRMLVDQKVEENRLV
ncbi:hypothetical protein PT974_02996 [Cladobotryum mycophilum]|uniref:Uncharacterized protein n=1 Tax=Cladobotryum mycophilum TaxID=491253 RepID=A0ABR0SZP6_9HYPO